MKQLFLTGISLVSRIKQKKVRSIHVYLYLFTYNFIYNIITLCYIDMEFHSSILAWNDTLLYWHGITLCYIDMELHFAI
jgi:hypothetical protein